MPSAPDGACLSREPSGNRAGRRGKKLSLEIRWRVALQPNDAGQLIAKVERATDQVSPSSLSKSAGKTTVKVEPLPTSVSTRISPRWSCMIL